MFGLIWFLIIGLAAGAIASRLAGERHTLFENLIVGVIGAFLGGAAFWLVGLKATGIIGSLVVATVGSILLLFLLDRYGGKRS
jgi:uncharacterized membrane protein YeaQ/YmgE (transglycosylase-associated protein family)